MIKVKGNLLMFNKPDLIGYIFPKDCKIDIPEVIPITYPDHIKPVGKITKVERDDSCIRIEGEIMSPDEEAIRKALSTYDVYASGYYNHITIRVPVEDHIHIIKSMALKSVGLVSGDVYGDHSLRLEEV